MLNPDHGIEAGGVTRADFLLRSALAAGALYGASAATPLVGRALAQSGDLDILNFALSLEHLEAAFYTQARDLPLSAELGELVAEFGQDERQHVDALEGTIRALGGEPVAPASYTFAMTDDASFSALAVRLEDTGVAAYNGAAPQIEDKKVLSAAGSIVQVEARHAGAIRFRTGRNPSPRTFDRTLERGQVLERVQPFVSSS